jgi:hypothetical protein
MDKYGKVLCYAADENDLFATCLVITVNKGDVWQHAEVGIMTSIYMVVSRRSRYKFDVADFDNTAACELGNIARACGPGG